MNRCEQREDSFKKELAVLWPSVRESRVASRAAACEI